jgi:hypothetical protein
VPRTGLTVPAVAGPVERMVRRSTQVGTAYEARPASRTRACWTTRKAVAMRNCGSTENSRGVQRPCAARR